MGSPDPKDHNKLRKLLADEGEALNGRQVVQAIMTGWKTRSVFDRCPIVSTTDQVAGLKKPADKRRGLQIRPTEDESASDSE